MRSDMWKKSSPSRSAHRMKANVSFTDCTTPTSRPDTSTQRRLDEEEEEEAPPRPVGDINEGGGEEDVGRGGEAEEEFEYDMTAG